MLPAAHIHLLLTLSSRYLAASARGERRGQAPAPWGMAEKRELFHTFLISTETKLIEIFVKLNDE